MLLSLFTFMRMLEFILYCITLTLQQKKVVLKCIFGLCGYRNKTTDIMDY